MTVTAHLANMTSLTIGWRPTADIFTVSVMPDEARGRRFRPDNSDALRREVMHRAMVQRAGGATAANDQFNQEKQREAAARETQKVAGQEASSSQQPSGSPSLEDRIAAERARLTEGRQEADLSRDFEGLELL
jgi:hypothetical protein